MGQSVSRTGKTETVKRAQLASIAHLRAWRVFILQTGVAKKHLKRLSRQKSDDKF
jgi:hypothetical protein